jgi:hypothetical protein
MGNSLEYKFLTVLIATAVFSYISWHAYSTQVMTVDPNSLPIIYAKKGIKSKPENPGGIEIANLDKGIYDYISGREPTNKKKSASYSREDAASREQILHSLGNTAKPLQTKTKGQKQEIFYLRIAKIKSPEFYDKALDIMLKKHKDTLKNLSATLYQERKTDSLQYYIHFGPLESKQEAETICNKIIAKDGQCKIFI